MTNSQGGDGAPLRVPVPLRASTVRCACCDRPIRESNAPRLYWCGRDHVCVCYDCSEFRDRHRSCPACSGRLRSVGGHFVLFAIASLVLLPTAAIAIPLMWPTAQLAQYPTIAIGALAPGDHAVTQGTIGGTPGTVVLSADRVPCGRGATCFAWQLRGFTISDGGATVSVDTTSLPSGNVNGAPHTTNGGDTEQYWAGDTVAIAGTVVNESGALTLRAAFLAPSEASLASGIGAYEQAVIAVSSAAGACSGLAVAFWAVRRRRFRISMQNAPAFRVRLRSE